jgi:acyl CoA:acetate/3-ketoacid CoA transferase
MTMEEYLLSQLETPVKLKDGTVATKEDGSVMTKQEAIATNILNQAMNRRSSESRAKRLAA